MTERRKIIQFILVSIGLFLIIATYFLYPSISKKKVLEDSILEKEDEQLVKNQTNTFDEVEYKGFYNVDNPFLIKSKKAQILNDDKDIIYMDGMVANIFLTDGRVVTITSDKGTYNKVTYDCYFVGNVMASDGETKVLSQNLNLLSSEDVADIYNNVSITSDRGTLLADKITYNFETKYYKISMFGDKKVNIKVVK